MMELNTALPWVLAFTAISLLIVQSLALRRRIARLEADWKERHEDIGRELHAVSSGSMGVGRRVMGCEKHLHQLQGAVDELRHNDPTRVSYDEASRLVGLGADVEDLMDTCGISRPEAELVSALHHRRTIAVS